MPLPTAWAGHAAGEVASEIAIQTLVANAPDTPDGDNLARAVVAANHAIIRAVHEGIGRKGMGTTMTAAMLSGKRLVIAQVGDSRAYLARRKPAAHNPRPFPYGRPHRFRSDHARRSQDPLRSAAASQRAPWAATFDASRHIRNERQRGRPPAFVLRRTIGHGR